VLGPAATHVFGAIEGSRGVDRTQARSPIDDGDLTGWMRMIKKCASGRQAQSAGADDHDGQSRERMI